MISHLPLEIRTLSDRLVDVLRDYILSGAIEADLPIRQDALAAQLRVSKIPLREALARLEQDGLVISQPNRGFFVQRMTPEEAEEIYALRLKLEPDAAAHACLIATEADQEAARQSLAAFDIDAAAHKPTVGALNRAFHLALVKPGGNRITTNIVSRLHILADRYVRKHLEPRGRVPRAEAEHHEMLDAWVKRKDAKVRKMLTEHLEGTLGDLRGVLRGDARAGKDEKKKVPVKRAAVGR
ncbi:MAG TPA: GntR family transcriptional regulator [Steroidobacteraceae bacterium]|nr:GntR family transcriptional regulator [Steroidobacteraceae bacterium]